ncbi:MAG: type secretion system protein [Marmoricola sp.]|nr:type secretion system protein [Marmoricola sp.]
MTGLVAAGVAACTVLLLGRRSGSAAFRARPLPAASRTLSEEPALLLRLRVPLVVLAVLAGWVVVGGPVGAAAGVAAGVVGWRVLGAVESPAAARRRRDLERDLPMAVHLFGAALAAGSAVAAAVGDVAEALPGAVGEELLVTRHRLLLGVDPVTVWRQLDGPLLPLGRSMARAQDSGASVVAAVESLAEELSAGSRQRTEALARTVEVRASAPLGLCFLPAFVVLGVVPMVVGIFSSVNLFG